MPSPDPTRRPGIFQGPDDAGPQPIRPFVVAEDELAAYLNRLDAEEAGLLRRARRRRLLVRAAIALFGLVMAAAVLLGVAAIRGGSHPGPTTVPAPVTVPAPGAGYVPVPAGKP
jgi:hypothetical protein